MELKSRLYKGSVYHNRIFPKRHRFRYPVFLFCLDLDELSTLSSKLLLFGNNCFSLYNFRDSDHLDYGSKCLKKRLAVLLREKGYLNRLERVELLANPSVFGFVFNPISVYFCYSKDDEPMAVVCEVCNNFFERKVYVFDYDSNARKGFLKVGTKKEFFISPYCSVDDYLSFKIKEPSKKPDVQVTTKRDGKPVIETFLSGEVLNLDDRNLLKSALYFPLYSMSVFARIHFQALMLLIKGVPFHQKDDFMEFQKNVFRPHKSLRKFYRESKSIEVLSENYKSGQVKNNEV